MAMPGRFRRSRLLALLLLLVTPGLGGWPIKMLHPCASAVQHAMAPEQGGEQHEEHGAPAHPGHQGECRCIGSCQVTTAIQHPTVPTVAAPIPSYRLTTPRPAESPLFTAGRVPDLHPPATAPPVQS